MPVGIPIDPKIKTEVIAKIRDEGMRVAEASEIYGFKPRLIYAWLNSKVAGAAKENNRNVILENNRLKKELDMAYRMLGKATTLMDRSKS